MSKKDYENVDDLFDDLLEDIEETVSQEIADEIKRIEQKAIDELVYNVYVPKAYVRRYDDGGLRDAENMEVRIRRKGDKVEIEVSNRTITNKAWGSYAFYNNLLQPLIEDGIYDWRGENPPPRPFIDETQERVDSSVEIERILSKVLKDLGW